jgi:hypothetical protein
MGLLSATLSRVGGAGPAARLAWRQAGTSRSDRPTELPIPDYDHLPEGSLAHGIPANNQPLRHGVAAQTPNRDIRAR